MPKKFWLPSEPQSEGGGLFVNGRQPIKIEDTSIAVIKPLYHFFDNIDDILEA
jgi:hypothetical protein